MTVVLANGSTAAMPAHCDLSWLMRLLCWEASCSCAGDMLSCSADTGWRDGREGGSTEASTITHGRDCRGGNCNALSWTSQCVCESPASWSNKQARPQPVAHTGRPPVANMLQLLGNVPAGQLSAAVTARSGTLQLPASRGEGPAAGVAARRLLPRSQPEASRCWWRRSGVCGSQMETSGALHG